MKRKQVHVPIEKIQEQDRFIEIMKEYTNRFHAIHGHKPRVLTQTFGCRYV
jgi:tRNA-2-methylthio-N6-dimethylallyladenosine synthase